MSRRKGPKSFTRAHYCPLVDLLAPTSPPGRLREGQGCWWRGGPSDRGALVVFDVAVGATPCGEPAAGAGARRVRWGLGQVAGQSRRAGRGGQRGASAERAGAPGIGTCSNPGQGAQSEIEYIVAGQSGAEHQSVLKCNARTAPFAVSLGDGMRSRDSWREPGAEASAPSLAAQSRAEASAPEQSRAEQSRAEQRRSRGRAERQSSASLQLCSTLLCPALLCPAT